MEEIDEYNRRVKKIISEYDYPHENFLLLDKGRNENEISVIVIENNRYFGYGYYNKVEIISNYGDLKSSVKKKKYFPKRIRFDATTSIPFNSFVSILLKIPHVWITL